MLTRFLGWLASLPIRGILETINKTVSEDTKRQEIAADLSIEWGRQHVQALAATATFRWWHPQNLIAYCVALYVGKIVVWDTVLGLGVTPYPGDHVTWLMMAVVGFYFLNRGIVEVAGRIASARK